MHSSCLQKRFTALVSVLHVFFCISDLSFSRFFCSFVFPPLEIFIRKVCRWEKKNKQQTPVCRFISKRKQYWKPEIVFLRQLILMMECCCCIGKRLVNKLSNICGTLTSVWFPCTLLNYSNINRTTTSATRITDDEPWRWRWALGIQNDRVHSI